MNNISIHKNVKDSIIKKIIIINIQQETNRTNNGAFTNPALTNILCKGFPSTILQSSLLLGKIDVSYDSAIFFYYDIILNFCIILRFYIFIYLITVLIYIFYHTMSIFLNLHICQCFVYMIANHFLYIHIFQKKIDRNEEIRVKMWPEILQDLRL